MREWNVSFVSRISREDMFLDIAQTVSGRGTCSRASVGCVIVRDARIISLGYNGAPPGQPHCVHREGEAPGCEFAIHAEANAIAYAARAGISTERATMFCTHSPCLKCAQLMLSAGITQVWWRTEYRIIDGVTLLRKAGVQCVPYPK